MMQFLAASQDDQGYHYSVWLDTSKTMDSQPDPAYVREYDWPLAPPSWDGGEAAYQDMITAEVKLLAQADLGTMSASQTDLSVQGQTF